MSIQYNNKSNSNYSNLSNNNISQNIQNNDDDDDILAIPVDLVQVSNRQYHSSSKEIQKAINIVVLTVFLGSTSFTILMPTMFDYLTDINESLGKYNGIIVALYSLGQFLSSPIFGWWGNRRSIVQPLILSIAVSVFGNLLYAILYKFEGIEVAVLMGIARFIVGVGAGNVSVCRAFASESSDLSNKTTTMAKMGAAQGAGFVLGPALGLVMSFFNFRVGGFRFDEYTSPAYLSVLFSIINIIIIALFLRDNSVKVGSNENEKKALLSKQQEDQDEEEEFINSPSNRINRVSDDDDAHGNPFRWLYIKLRNWVRSHQQGQKLLPIFISIYVFMVVITIFSVFESMLPVMTKRYFGWGAKQNYYILGSTGALSIVVFVIISLPLIKKFDDRKTTLFGLSNLFVALLFICNYGYPFNIEGQLPLWQFLVGSLFVSIGYPIASSLVYAIYSKVLNPKSQGTKMGWLTAGGSLARMLGPVWAQAIWNADSDEGTALFLVTASICLSGIIILASSYRLLDPHPDYKVAPKVEKPDIEKTPIVGEETN
ncbi:hypothetical protein DLAC_07787 [Tieghemostelium lacteum]|uniref:Major facilitator superfamily (MFS) profile domain-containing protein n=1 Tax=Tieghemostelium lacteum TaxID=361077 RepID=A0A151ZAF1_TIELA|nr:hypothetical protein DLAC_07787 [Tieghemostelium lacteum]|eukprot:KYQ90913.1 hypothetical protein DLAC_07787 [Tieghemostelium lacteum]